MKRAGSLVILLGSLGFAGFVLAEYCDSEHSYFVGWLFALALISLGASFRAIALPLEKRKKVARIVFPISLLMLCTFFIFKHQHYRGASFFPILFFDLFVLVFLPIHTKNRIEKWRKYTRKTWHAVLLSMGNQLSLGLVFGGLLCRVYHWPFANVFLMIGLVFLAVSLMGWNQLFSREIVLRKEAEEKVNDAFNTLKVQHVIIEEKNSEILASINYAKRLQEAILPPEKMWQACLPDSFVLYQPKDIVAGDFYWIEKVNGSILFAAADCTGHGVPGAMVSVVCSNALNRAVKEFNLSDPGSILDKVRELVIETFEKSENEVKDGMDISLCCLNPLNNSMTWAGANNSLWMIKAAEAAGSEVLELKPDKQPIGKYADEKPFTSHSLQLNKGDLIYLFTDGYADQFGGPNGKKFKYKQLKELLLAASNLPMAQQKKKLNDALTAWKNNLEHVDDVCIIGLRI